MADVTTRIELPAQPLAPGRVSYQSLGGDGYTAPKGMYSVTNVTAVGDGSGAGVLACELVMDPNYVNLILYASMGLVQAAPTDIDIQWLFVGVDQNLPTQYRRTRLEATVWKAPECADTWVPVASLNSGPSVLGIHVDEIGVDSLTLNAQIFLFDIRSRERWPYGLLAMAASGGAGGQSTSTS